MDTHDKLVHNLYHHPKFFGIDINSLNYRAIECGLYIRGELFVTPDIIFEDNSRKYFIEVKSCPHAEYIRHKARNQLVKIDQWASLQEKDYLVGLCYPKIRNCSSLDKINLEWFIKQ